MACAHIRYVTFWNFKQRLNKNDIMCKNNVSNLNHLCMLYGLSELNKNSTACYESGYFSGTSDYSDLIMGAIKKINFILRPQIIPIIESLKVKDMQA